MEWVLVGGLQHWRFTTLFPSSMQQFCKRWKGMGPCPRWYSRVLWCGYVVELLKGDSCVAGVMVLKPLAVHSCVANVGCLKCWRRAGILRQGVPVSRRSCCTLSAMPPLWPYTVCTDRASLWPSHVVHAHCPACTVYYNTLTLVLQWPRTPHTQAPWQSACRDFSLQPTNKGH